MTLPGITHYAPKSKIVIFLLILGCFAFFTCFTSHKHISSSAQYLHTQHDQLTFWQAQRAPVNNVSLTSRNRTIMYVHVGKTGGTSLDRVLRSNCEWYPAGARDRCLEALPKNESRLSHLTKRSLHMWKTARIHRVIQQYSNSIAFLFTIRNPVNRAVSAFNYEHMLNFDMDSFKNTPMGIEKATYLKEIFYVQCFPTIEDMSITLATGIRKFEYTDKENRTQDCHPLAVAAITGKSNIAQGGYHLLYNYAYYAKITSKRYPDKEILVLRTEELWDDVEKLNQGLGGEHGEVFVKFKDHKFSYGSESKMEKSGLSEQGKATICCFLSDENQIFEDLLRRAANIDESEKEGYLDELYDDCQVPKEMRLSGNFTWFQWRIDTCP